MRPHRLELQAFGPFADHEVVDFSLLSDQGLFVVTGPTGSGKSTVFDAMVFALYGKVPGDRPEREIRSHHADDQTVTFVELEFTVDGGRYLVRRTPPQPRPKRRGHGVTAALGEAVLHERLPTGALHPLASGVAECTKWCSELIGLDADQFQRVVLLPQGKFANFLLARSSEREPLLRHLFGTHVYDRATEHLRSSVSHLTSELSEIERDAAAYVQQARTALADATDDPIDPDADVVALAAYVDRLEADLPARRRHVGDLRRVAHAASEHLTRSTELAARWDDRAALRYRVHELEVAEPHLTAAATRVGAAQRAGPVVESCAELQRATDELSRATVALGQATEQISAAFLELGVDQSDVRSVAVAASLTTLRARLDGQRQRFEAANSADHDAEQARQRADHDRGAYDAAVGHLDELDAQVAALSQERDRLTPVAAELDRRVLDLEAARRRGAHRTQLDARTDELSRAVEALQRLHEHYLTTMARYVATEAPRLAATLEPGEPCPVCGGREHPAPARSQGDDAVDHHMVIEAQRDHASAAQLVATLQASVEQLRQSLGEALDWTPRELDEHLARAEISHDDARRAQQRCAELVDEIALHTSRRSVISTEVETLATTSVLSAAESTRLRARADSLHLDAGGITLQSLDDEARSLRSLEEHSDSLHELEHQLVSVRRQHELAAAQHHEVLAGSGFGSLEAAQHAHLPAEQVAELSAQVSRWEDELTRCRSQLAVYDGLELPESRPDLEADRVARDATDAAFHSAQRALDRVEGALSRCRGALGQASETQHRVLQLRAEHEVAQRTFGACNGDTPSRLTLSTWVLAHELDRVTAHANVHLAQLTQHRYRLVRVDRAGARGRTGLDLQVFDAHTGRERPASTLSGGEQFQASLALALGLADVVSHGGVASGRSFDTLFIDEGFGALDPESLDEAIATLYQLQARGRLVGAITHVEVMKQQLPVGIDIRRCSGGRGSTLVVAPRTVA